MVHETVDDAQDQGADNGIANEALNSSLFFVYILIVYTIRHELYVCRWLPVLQLDKATVRYY